MPLFWSARQSKRKHGVHRVYPLNTVPRLRNSHPTWWVEEVPHPCGVGVLVYDNNMCKRVDAKFWAYPWDLTERQQIMDFLESFYDGLAQDQKDGKAESAVPVDPKMQKAYPRLFAFVTVKIVKKQPREPGTLFIFTQQGQFKGCLTDKKTEMTLWQAQDTFEGLLAALEADLESGDRSRWRKKTIWKGKGK